MTTPNPAANLDDSETFDVDGWIDGIVRPETVVELYPNEAHFRARVAAIEAQIPAAEQNMDRGLDDPTPEALFAQIQELQAERARGVMRVRVRQMTRQEITERAFAAKKAGVAIDDMTLWAVSIACVEPALTVDQLERLRSRDITGEQMVNQLIVAVNDLQAGGPAVPS